MTLLSYALAAGLFRKPQSDAALKSSNFLFTDLFKLKGGISDR